MAATVNDLAVELAQLRATVEAANVTSDNVWVLSMAFVILTMQAGFGSLEAGCVSSRSSANILMKNVRGSCWLVVVASSLTCILTFPTLPPHVLKLMDMNIGALGFWAVGYAIAFGDQGGSFAGWGPVALWDTPIADYPAFFMSFAFASTSATVVSGAVCGRMKFHTYVFISCLITAVIYPVAAHWVWHKDGWLKQLGFTDFAGDSAVHMLGGLAGLVCNVILGPREGAFAPNGDYLVFRSSPTNVLLGVFILWWGWFAFNAGSTGAVSDFGDLLASKVAVNTAVASGAGTLGALLFSRFLHKDYVDVYETVTGTLAGLVAVTACCHAVYPIEAIVIGAMGGLLGNLSAFGLIKLRIDDPVGVVPVHFVAALWGLIAAGFFVGEDEIMGGDDRLLGLLHGGGLELLGVQLLGIAAICGWTLVTMVALVLTVNYFNTVRVDLDVEKVVLRAVEVQGSDGPNITSVPSERGFATRSFMVRKQTEARARLGKAVRLVTVANRLSRASTGTTASRTSSKASVVFQMASAPSFMSSKRWGPDRILTTVLREVETSGIPKALRPHDHHHGESPTLSSGLSGVAASTASGLSGLEGGFKEPAWAASELGTVAEVYEFVPSPLAQPSQPGRLAARATGESRGDAAGQSRPRPEQPTSTRPRPDSSSPLPPISMDTRNTRGTEADVTERRVTRVARAGATRTPNPIA